MSQTLKTHFDPNWDSLSNYEVPEWYRDAKLGFWAHWSPQCVPEMGDWYARNMYSQGHPHYQYHLEHYGHPSKFGYKDICNLWKAENWDPEALIARYKRAGAKYFTALGNHHCNFDTWNSRYHQLEFGQRRAKERYRWRMGKSRPRSRAALRRHHPFHPQPHLAAVLSVDVWRG